MRCFDPHSAAHHTMDTNAIDENISGTGNYDNVDGLESAFATLEHLSEVNQLKDFLWRFTMEI